MAAQQDVDNYLNAIRLELSDYGNKLSIKHQIGDKPSFDKEVKFMLLQAFVDIADFYLQEWDTPNDNGLTISEFEDIEQHINKIANSFNWLDLN